jgi:pimeloyl-ACP methyl ester carboxylesterase
MTTLDSLHNNGNTVSNMNVEDIDVHPDSEFVAVDGMRIHYKRAGSGPTVVLLHGSASSLYGVEAVAQRLNGSFDVIRPDLPGFGVTGQRPDRDYRVVAYAATVARFLEVIGVDRCVVAGNSLGGNIAWNLALDHRDRVGLAGLVLINATGYPDKALPAGMALARNPIAGQLLRRFMPRRAVARSLRQTVGPNSHIVDDAMVERAHRLWNRPGNRAAFVDFLTTAQLDRSAEIPTISVPTLVLRSATMDGQHFARDISGSVEKVHPDGGHLLPEEDPEWVAEAIVEFWQTLTA